MFLMEDPFKDTPNRIPSPPSNHPNSSMTTPPPNVMKSLLLDTQCSQHQLPGDIPSVIKPLLPDTQLSLHQLLTESPNVIPSPASHPPHQPTILGTPFLQVSHLKTPTLNNPFTSAHYPSTKLSCSITCRNTKNNWRHEYHVEEKQKNKI